MKVQQLGKKTYKKSSNELCEKSAKNLQGFGEKQVKIKQGTKQKL